MKKSQKIWKEITADKKRLGMLVACMAIGLLMWGRLLLKKVPKTAVADPSAVAVDPGAAESNGEFAGPMKVVFLDLPDESRRNVFQMDSSPYERIKIEQIPVEPQNTEPKVTDDEIRQKLLAELSSLKLQTTLMGQQPQAIVNNKLFGLGGTPKNGFVITKITQHSVVLKNGSFEFELKMYRKD